MSAEVIQPESTIANENQNLEVESKLIIETGLSELKLNEQASSTDKTNDLNGGLDAKQKKKYDKLIDNILKRSNNGPQLNTIEDKFYALVQKHIDLQEQNKKLQLNNKEIEKTIANYVKQRDIMEADCNKSIQARAKLESLCRELQKHNKLIKEENLQRIKEEEEKRKEITTKFQAAIDEINQQVGQNTEKNNSLIQENVQLTNKLKSLLEQYEVREQHVEKVLKHKDLELQLANAKLQQSELKLAEQAERSKGEKGVYEGHILELNKKCEFHQEAEKQLKSQLSMYTEKYEEFQTTLKKSNQVFESFRTEMDKMTKKIKKLEQETTAWKGKYESSEKTLLNIVKVKEDLEEKLKKSNLRAEAMEKLSRTLQTERNTLKEELKQYKDPTSEPKIDNEPAQPVQEENVKQEQNNAKEEVGEEVKPVEVVAGVDGSVQQETPATN